MNTAAGSGSANDLMNGRYSVRSAGTLAV